MSVRAGETVYLAVHTDLGIVDLRIYATLAGAEEWGIALASSGWDRHLPLVPKPSSMTADYAVWYWGEARRVGLADRYNVQAVVIQP